MLEPAQMILSDYGVMQIHGKDAADFLQKQTINDINEVSANHSQLNGYCSPKGRLLAIFRVLQWQDSYYLIMPAELIKSIMQRLQMYILRAAVTLKNVSSELLLLGVCNDRTTLAECLEKLPNAVNQVCEFSDQIIVQLPGVDRFLVLATAAKINQLEQALLARGLTTKPSKLWELSNILQGIPTIYSSTSEHFVPQMLNMQLINGISFKKGCYPGQEVVARTQYLGKLKKRMYLVSITIKNPPPAGTSIAYLSDNQSAKPAGEIVAAEQFDATTVMALAVLTTEHLKAELVLQTDDQPGIKLTDQPYDLED